MSRVRNIRTAGVESEYKANHCNPWAITVIPILITEIVNMIRSKDNG